MVQRKTLRPIANVVAELTGDKELLRATLPLMTDQVPTPVVIVFAARRVEGELAHRV